jgi:hypothetical protein
MLSEPALALLRGVFGRDILFAGRPRVTRRVVSWGAREPMAVAHEGIVLSDAMIRSELQTATADSVAEDLARTDGHAGTPGASFTIHAEDPLPCGEKMIFGEREAVAVAVALHGDTLREECRVEALDHGWLFLLPADAGRGWLMAFGAMPGELLSSSRLIAPFISLAGEVSAPFLTAPRMAVPLAGGDWLACGTAALGFDPICGDGTAQAVREAVLAAAVVKAIAQGGDRESLITHYSSMLLAGMRRHLQLCAEFYRTGGEGEWWRLQAESILAGYHACTRMLGMMPEPRYVLRGFALEPRVAAV